MDFNKLLKDLPGVIGEAVWRHLQQTGDISKADLLKDGEVKINLPSLNIDVSLGDILKNTGKLQAESDSEENAKPSGSKEQTADSSDSPIPVTPTRVSKGMQKSPVKSCRSLQKEESKTQNPDDYERKTRGRPRKRDRSESLELQEQEGSVKRSRGRPRKSERSQSPEDQEPYSSVQKTQKPLEVQTLDIKKRRGRPRKSNVSTEIPISDEKDIERERSPSPEVLEVKKRRGRPRKSEVSASVDISMSDEKYVDGERSPSPEIQVVEVKKRRGRPRKSEVSTDVPLLDEKGADRERSPSPEVQDLDESEEEYLPEVDDEDSDEEVVYKGVSTAHAFTPRSSKRLCIKNETLGQLDFSKGIKRDPKAKVRRSETMPSTSAESQDDTATEDDAKPSISTVKKRGRPHKIITETPKANSVTQIKSEADLSKKIKVEPTESRTYNMVVEVDITCRICKRVCQGVRGATAHMKIHKGEEMRLECGLCDKVFDDCQLLRGHIEAHQRGELVATKKEFTPLTPVIPPTQRKQRESQKTRKVIAGVAQAAALETVQPGTSSQQASMEQTVANELAHQTNLSSTTQDMPINAKDDICIIAEQEETGQEATQVSNIEADETTTLLPDAIMQLSEIEETTMPISQKRGRGRPRKSLEIMEEAQNIDETQNISEVQDTNATEEMLDTENTDTDATSRAENSEGAEICDGNENLAGDDQASDEDWDGQTVTCSPSFAPLKIALDYECNICFKTFNRKSSLKEHVFIHDRNSGFSCDTCGRHFARWFKVKQHAKQAHGVELTAKDKARMKKINKILTLKLTGSSKITDITDIDEGNETLDKPKKRRDDKPRPFRCQKCDKVFTDGRTLKEHEFLHMNESRFFCEHCIGKFVSFKKLAHHMKIVHAIDITAEEYRRLVDILPPEGCVGFCDREKCQVHELKDYTMKCRVCDMFEGSREQAVEHMVTAHGEHFIQTCEYCSESFQYAVTLKNHQQYLHKAEFRHQCASCLHMFARLEDLASHAKRVHDVDIDVKISRRRVQDRKGPYYCPHCGQSFQKQNRLNDHIWVKHDKKEKPYECPECSKRFIREDLLRCHMFIHNRVSRYQCETCGKVFRKKFELEQHRHVDDPWKCAVCDHTFTTYSGYKMHVRKHTEVPHLMCRFCGAMFFHKRRLENHERTHTKEKPFKCPTCNAAFGDLYTFNKHKKAHTMPKLPCSKCTRTFLYPGQLRTHELTHEKKAAKSQAIAGYGCKVCGKSFVKEETLKKHMNVHGTYKDKPQIYFQCNVCRALHTKKSELTKCKNSHYQLANSVADFVATDEAEFVTGAVEADAVTGIAEAEVENDEDTQVLVVSLEDLQGMGDQYVIGQGSDMQETIKQFILQQNQFGLKHGDTIEIIHPDALAGMEATESIGDTEASQDASETTDNADEVTDQTEGQIIEHIIDHVKQDYEVVGNDGIVYEDAVSENIINIKQDHEEETHEIHLSIREAQDGDSHEVIETMEHVETMETVGHMVSEDGHLISEDGQVLLPDQAMQILTLKAEDTIQFVTHDQYIGMTTEVVSQD